jgi:hypothetical protein
LNGERLVLHRIVSDRNGTYVVRGDNTLGPDGVMGAHDLLGRVIRVERHGRRVLLGFGPERLAVALLSKHGDLVPLVAVARRVHHTLRGIVRSLLGTRTGKGWG